MDVQLVEKEKKLSCFGMGSEEEEPSTYPEGSSLGNQERGIASSSLGSPDWGTQGAG